MRLSYYSVHRPIGVTMLCLIIILFGIVALTHLPIDLMPDITYPTLSITASYENASPVEIETLLTRPIEQALAAVPGVEEVTSRSSEGQCRVRIIFTWGTDLDAAANDVRDRLDRMLGRLPDGVDRPRLRKYDLANFPILVVGVSGDLDPVQLLKIVEDQVKYRLERLPGVAALDISGGRKREVHVNLLINRLKALGIRPDTIVSRLRRENTSQPAGIIEVSNFEYIVRTPGEFNNIEQIGAIPVKEDNGSIIYLREVARIEDRWEKARGIIRVNGKPGLQLRINKQSGKNTVDVAEAVKRELKMINRDLPQLRIATRIDSSKYIRRSIDNVSSAAIFGGTLAIFILLFFLGDLRSTLIIGISIPFSIIATFSLMYFNGFTLNIMSLGGVALGIGMLVDNSIVVLENIFRLKERGEKRIDAAIEGSEAVAAPILASTLTTLVIFLPLFFVKGMTGLMFKQLAWVVGFSLTSSLLLSLTMVPMLSSQMLSEQTIGGGGYLFALPRWILGKAEWVYLKILTLFIHWRLLTSLFFTLLLAGSLLLVPTISTEFMPSADESEVRVTAEMAVGTKLSLVKKKMLTIEKVIQKEVPEQAAIITTIGASGRGRSVNRGDFRVPLVSRKERKRSSAEVAVTLGKKLSKIPGMKIRTREGRGLFVFRIGQGTVDKVQVQIRGHDFEDGQWVAQKVESALNDIEGIVDVRVSRESGVPERLISIDRKRAADQGLTIGVIANFLKTLLSGSSAGNFREGGDEYRILVQAADTEKLSLKDIMDLTILNNKGQSVALKNVAEFREKAGPVQIDRVDQERVINVSADPGIRPIGEILPEVVKKLNSIPLPRGFSVILSGDYEEQQKAFRDLFFSFILAIVLVYMVMSIQYESLADPFIVMFTVPFSAIGVILSLVLTGTSFNVQSFIGCIMLGGIVVNNSIILVDHVNHLFYEKGVALAEALIEGGRDRFRPILMTASTTIIGLLPLALGAGEGGEVQAPLARVVIGGLTCSTIISLLFIPVVYSLVAAWRAPKTAGAAGDN
ncbi:efflux RND transporter permease subunit [Candidatus Riflebacteria bacterium]